VRCETEVEIHILCINVYRKYLDKHYLHCVIIYGGSLKNHEKQIINLDTVMPFLVTDMNERVKEYLREKL